MRLQPDKNITNKPILKTLITVSWPIIFGQIMQLLYILGDTFWIGKLGPDYLAAISISLPLIFIVISLAAGFSIAGMTLVAQYTGAQLKEKADLAAGQCLFISVLISGFLSGLGLIFGQELLKLMGVSGETLFHSWEYFQVMMGAIPLFIIFHIFTSILQGIGNSLTPMKTKMVIVTGNIIFDPIFIFGWSIFPELGVKGAAVGTIVAYSAGSIVGLYILSSGKYINIKITHLKPKWKIIKKILYIGLPAALGMSGLAVGMSLMTSIVARFGNITLAAWGISKRIISFIHIPAVGLSRGTGILVGQYLGNNQPKETNKTVFISSTGTFCLIFIIAIILPYIAPFLISIFTNSVEVIKTGTQYLKIVGFGYAFFSIHQIFCGALRGAGKTIEQTVFRFLTLLILQIPLSLLFAFYLSWGERGIWWGIFTAKLVGTLIIFIWFIQGKWQNKVIED